MAEYSKCVLLVGVLLLGAVWITTVHADPDDAQAGLGTAVVTAHFTTEFSYPGGVRYQADVSRYAVVILQPVAPDMDFGLEGAYVVTGMNSPALTTLDAADGHAYGMSLHWHPRFDELLGFEMYGGYRWNDVVFSTGSNGGHALDWHESYMAAGPVLYLDRWRVSLGASWRETNGHETDPGLRLGFSSTRNIAAWLGLTYYLDRTGSVGFYVLTGAEHGGQLVFKREF